MFKQFEMQLAGRTLRADIGRVAAQANGRTNKAAKITVNDNSGTANALDTDFAMIMVYNADKQEAVYDMTSTCRGDEGSSLRYPSDWVGDTVHVYLAFVSEDGTLVSDSEYVGSMTIA